MRILLIHKYHYRLGGAERVYLDTGRILQEAGHEVAFFSMQHPKNESTPWSKYFVSEVDYQDEKKNLWQKAVMAFRIIWNHEANRKLDALIQDFKPDVAHCFNIYHQLSLSIFWILKKHRVPTVMTLCDFKGVSPNYFLYHFEKRQIWDSVSGWRCIAEKCIKNSYVKSAICALEKWLHDAIGSYKQVRFFLSPSAFLIKKYQELGSDFDIRQVHHPAVVSEDEAWSVTPLEERSDEYLYFGRFSVEKGVEVIIRALSRMKGSSKLLLVGYGAEEQALRCLVEELHLEERVEFLGGKFDEELKPLLRRPRAIVLSSVWYENQPFAMLQALASGTLLVASRIGSLTDVLTHGENSLLFEAGNPRDLAQVLQSIPEYDYQKLVENAHQTALANTEENYHREIEAAYQEVTKKPE